MVKYFFVDIRLAIYSSPRFSTWIWLPDWHLLIDAGDGVSAQLGYKIRKIDTVLLTHAHRDHVGGLMQVVNQRGEAGSFALGFPAGADDFGALEGFCLKFNPGASRNAVWHKLNDYDEMPSGVDGRLIRAFRTQHYKRDIPGTPPLSLGYDLIWRKQKLRQKYQRLSQAELDEVRLEIGREGITEEIEERWITVSGDCSPLDAEQVRGTKLLIHEATFLSAEDYAADEETRVGHIHSTVWDALLLAQKGNVENVVLYHISTRYTDKEIKDAIHEQASKLQLKANVWAALPRRVHWNLLRGRPLWQG